MRGLLEVPLGGLLTTTLTAYLTPTPTQPSTQDKHHVSFAELRCHCLIKDLVTASLPEYVATHSHQTDYLVPLRTRHYRRCPSEPGNLLVLG